MIGLDPYIAAIVAIMFVAGIVLTLLTARNRFMMRKLWNAGPRG